MNKDKEKERKICILLNYERSSIGQAGSDEKTKYRSIQQICVLGCNFIKNAYFAWYGRSLLDGKNWG